jgi:HSP20 family protein
MQKSLMAYKITFQNYRRVIMADVTPLPVKKEKIEPSSSLQAFESLCQEISRMFDDFGWGPWPPFRRSLAADPLFARGLTRTTMPAVDVVESEKAYEITAELAGMDEKNIEVKVANGILTIGGEKQEGKEEKKKDYYLQERHYGSFERSFEVPESVETGKIEATFKKGLLTVTLPKKVEAQAPAKKVELKAA